MSSSCAAASLAVAPNAMLCAATIETLSRLHSATNTSVCAEQKGTQLALRVGVAGEGRTATKQKDFTNKPSTSTAHTHTHAHAELHGRAQGAARMATQANGTYQGAAKVFLRPEHGGPLPAEGSHGLGKHRARICMNANTTRRRRLASAVMTTAFKGSTHRHRWAAGG
jgi:hypothetical protein